MVQKLIILTFFGILLGISGCTFTQDSEGNVTAHPVVPKAVSQEEHQCFLYPDTCKAQKPTLWCNTFPAQCKQAAVHLYCQIHTYDNVCRAFDTNNATHS